MIERIVKKYTIINKTFTFVGSLVVKFLGLFTNINNKRILFSSGMGKFIGDSSIVIYNAIKEDPFFEDYELIWAVNDVEKYQQDYNVVKLNSVKYFLTALTSRIWITSVNIERGLKFKRDKNFYINTWHGIPLKYIGSDVKGRSDYNLSNIDVFLVSGLYEERIYEHAFKLNKNQMYRWGLPRNIELETYNPEKREATLKDLNLENLIDKKIILFAPTWKDHEYELLDLEYIANNLSDDTVLVVKSHPLEKLSFNHKKILDVSHISNVPNLLKVTDVLISDYSSIMIDYSFLNRPIVSYAPDFEVYEKLRGLYVTKDELAPNVLNTSDEVLSFINSYDLENESMKTQHYNRLFFNVSSINSVDKILDAIKKEVS